LRKPPPLGRLIRDDSWCFMPQPWGMKAVADLSTLNGVAITLPMMLSFANNNESANRSLQSTSHWDGKS